MIRPQPIDLAPWPLGGLLLPETGGGPALAADAVAGREVEVTDDLAFWAHAAEDNPIEAHASMAEYSGPVVDYNRFVLAPSDSDLAALRATLDGAYGELLELAAFKCGLRTDLPEFTELDGELLASARGAAASAAMEAEDTHGAAYLLEEAIQLARPASRGLAAQLTLSLVEVERLRGKGFERLTELLRGALEDIGKTGFGTLRAELELELGVILQESSASDPRRIQEASKLFQSALLGLDPERHPRSHGFAQMRLGLTYLSMPMHDAGDALRMGVATQALRRAVEVLRPEREPDLWCSAAANLANAYQLLPSGHLADNIEKGIALYDQALEIRRADGDPYGTARLLMNKAQAAATLEKRTLAIEALAEACPLLAELRLSDELNTARHMMEDLRRQATTAGDPA